MLSKFGRYQLIIYVLIGSINVKFDVFSLSKEKCKLVGISVDVKYLILLFVGHA